MLQQLVVKMQEMLHRDIICEYIVVVKFCKNLSHFVVDMCFLSSVDVVRNKVKI